jgi:hypothetical protein
LYKTAHIIIWKKKQKNVMSQYEFRYNIVMAWFGCLPDQQFSENKKKRTWDEFSSITSATAASSQKRAKHVNDKSLDPISGSLRDRLGTDFHYIIESESKDPSCSVCRWAMSTESKRDDRVRGKCIGTCDKCGINICMKCFKIFHTIGNVKKLRAEVCTHLNRKK